MSTKLKYSTLLVLLSASIMAYAQPSSLPSGDEIARNINARNEGVSLSRNLIMELTDKRGKKRIRKTKSFRKYFGEEKRTVIHYLSPKNVKHTAFLTYDYPDANKDDDQWLYLPALRKVRRISAADRGDYFLGTDFTYEDIKKESKVNIEDYTRKTLRAEEFAGHPCYVVEATPINADVADELGYGKVVQWVDSNIWMIRKAAFYDTRNKPLKTIITRDIRQVQGIFTAHHIEVKNHKTGHKTVFQFSSVDYEKGVSDDYFTERALRRGL